MRLSRGKTMEGKVAFWGENLPQRPYGFPSPGMQAVCKQPLPPDPYKCTCEMHVCVCTYARIHVYMWVYVHICMYTHLLSCTPFLACMCMCACLMMYACFWHGRTVSQVSDPRKYIKKETRHLYSQYKRQYKTILLYLLSPKRKKELPRPTFLLLSSGILTCVRGKWNAELWAAPTDPRLLPTYKEETKTESIMCT